MHISSVEIINFRGIKELVLEDFKTLNLFLGKNNAGKTSILEAIFISLAPNNPAIFVNIDNMRNLIYNQSDDFRNIFNKLDYSNTIQINTKYYLNGVEKELRITPKKQSSIPIATQQEANFVSTADKDLVNGLALSYSYKKKHGKKEDYSASITMDNGAFQQMPANYKEATRAVLLTGNAYYPTMSIRLGKMIEAKKEEEIIRFLKPIDNSIQGLVLGANNIILVDTGFGRRFPINLLGDGVIRLLAILLAIYDSVGGVLLIDEINNGLHFTALKSLWQSILSSAVENKVQIFATTHDYETIKHLKAVLEEENYKKFQPDVRSYTIRKFQDGALKGYKYKFEELEAAIDQEIEIR